MKKITAVLIIAVIALSAVSCGIKQASLSKADYDRMIGSYVQSPLNTFELTVGDAHSPTAAVWLKNGNGSGTSYSSDENVVTVSEYGKVTAVGAGSAYVVITGLGDMFEVYRYDVYEKAPEADLSNLPVIDGIDLAKEIELFNSTSLNTVTLKKGQTHTPTASVWAKAGGPCYTTDASVVTVDKNGNVTAAGTGTAYVVIRSSISTSNMFEMYKYIVKG